MGWGEGYRIMEEQVVGLYNQGLLDKKVLDILMIPFRGRDVDSGGSMNLISNDGKNVEEIICFIVKPEEYKKAADSELDRDENTEMIDLWYEITREEYDFR